ncbi:hypothetical protein ILUMI_03190 [Ignelater luminosus]|uniref:Uncharacterized protein n=1 Tax=Ignelater luminosus TaxID=2038154 RepID=A0A8K0DGS2_IGNLU|nr:hypothetical protein ILUMI_03190 [Ignelater luminosus]
MKGRTFSILGIECEAEIGIDTDFLNKAFKENHYPNDDKLKCYFKCLNIKLGVMNEKGDVNDDRLKYVASHFSDASTEEEIVVECGNIEGADLCETAFKLMACVKNATLD